MVMRTPLFRCLSVQLLVFLFIASEAFAEQKTCQGVFRDGISPSAEQLIQILKNHRVWWSDSHRKDTDERRANFCGADLRKAQLSGQFLAGADLRDTILSKVDLSGADLREANLSGARLDDTNMFRSRLDGAVLEKAKLSLANLKEVDMSGANLNEAELIGTTLIKARVQEARLHKATLDEADLSDARLDGTDLREARLAKAILHNANLSQGNLNGAVLDAAKLEGVILDGADLTGASLISVNLAHVDLDLKPGAIPNIYSLSSENNISLLTYKNSPGTLVELREALKKAGKREEERAITFAIRYQDTQRANLVERAFNFIMFELPCDYGMFPGRPLRILGVLILSFTFPYIFALKRVHGDAGIWAVFPVDSTESDQRSHRNVVRATPEFFHRGLRLKLSGSILLSPFHPLSLVSAALFFSILSAFNIGWEKLNIGDWISRLQTREYVLRATGWVRFVSGLQSLISVYLVALWVLTYFGRPFE